MNVLVTGGGGFLGTRIVQLLAERGDSVRVLGRHQYPHLAPLKVECVVGDIRVTDTVRDACAGMDAVIHTAAKAGVWGTGKEFCETNIRGTANVIQGCLRAKVTALVHTSSPSVAIGQEDIEGGDESLPYPQRYLAHYPATKAEAERMVLEANGWEMVVETAGGKAGNGARPDSVVRKLHTCALRPHLIWGPHDPHLIPRIVQRARQGKLVQVGDGRNRVDITYVDNAAWAHVLALDELMSAKRNAGNAYFVGDAEPVVLWEWIGGLLERLQIGPIKRRLSYRTARRIGAMLELLHTLLPILGEPKLTRFVATQLAKSHYFCHDRARRDFGYRARVDGETGLQRLVQWLACEEDREAGNTA